MSKLPRNETREHFLLKQTAVAWLKQQGCFCAAPEIWGMGTDSDFERIRPSRNKSFTDFRDVADAVGVCGSRGKRFVKSVEVKVSRTDLASGFCLGGHYVYVLCPPGLAVPNDLPNGVGLLECDPESASVSLHPANEVIVVRKARRKEVEDQMFASKVVERIARRLTIHYVFYNPWLGYG